MQEQTFQLVRAHHLAQIFVRHRLTIFPVHGLETRKRLALGRRQAELRFHGPKQLKFDQPLAEKLRAVEPLLIILQERQNILELLCLRTIAVKETLASVVGIFAFKLLVDMEDQVLAFGVVCKDKRIAADKGRYVFTAPCAVLLYEEVLRRCGAKNGSGHHGFRSAGKDDRVFHRRLPEFDRCEWYGIYFFRELIICAGLDECFLVTVGTDRNGFFVK